MSMFTFECMTLTCIGVFSYCKILLKERFDEPGFVFMCVKCEYCMFRPPVCTLVLSETNPCVR